MSFLKPIQGFFNKAKYIYEQNRDARAFLFPYMQKAIDEMAQAAPESIDRLKPRLIESFECTPKPISELHRMLNDSKTFANGEFCRSFSATVASVMALPPSLVH